MIPAWIERELCLDCLLVRGQIKFLFVLRTEIMEHEHRILVIIQTVIVACGLFIVIWCAKPIQKSAPLAHILM